MKLKFIFFALIAAIFGYSTYWFYVAGNVGVYLEKTSQDLAARGLEFSYQDYSVSGFPYRLVLHFKAPRFRFKNGALEATLDAQQMDAVAQPWDIHHVILFPEPSTISIKFSSKHERTLFLTPAKTSISVHNEGNEFYRLSVELEDVTLKGNLSDSLPPSLKKLGFHIRKKPAGDVTAALYEPRLLDIVLEGKKGEEDSFMLSTSFLGEGVPEITVPSLEAWRDNGGTFEIDELKVTKLNRQISGTGSFTLDQTLRPLGSLGLSGATNAEIIAFLESDGLITPDQVKTVTEFLASLPPPSGGEKEMPLSFTIQDGYLSLGPARLMEVGPVIRD